MLPVETNIKQAYANGMDAEQQFIQDLALFFCSYLKEHGELVEKGENNEKMNADEKKPPADSFPVRCTRNRKLNLWDHGKCKA